MACLERCYLGLTKIGEMLQSPFLLIVRLFWGYAFFFAGFFKLINIDPVIGFFTSLGIPYPTFSAYLAAYVELFGGLFLFFGLASRLVAIPLIVNMVVAYLTAEKDALAMILMDPFNFVMRTPFTFLLAALLIFLFGPGFFSIDRWICYVRRKKRLKK